MSTTVLIADDQPMMRAALRTCLDGEPDLRVVGEAGDGAACLELVRTLRPDVVVLDVRMPGVDGLETARRIAALPPPLRVRVVVLTTFDLDEYIVDAVRAGVRGFLLKDSSPEEFVRAVRLVAAGEAYLAPAVTRRLLDLRGATLAPVTGSGPDPAVGRLTERELTVLELVSRGLSNREVADALCLAHSSVKGHVSHLLAKLGLVDRVQLVVFAYEHDLVRRGVPAR